MIGVVFGGLLIAVGFGPAARPASAQTATPDGKVLDQPPKGFFINLALAQGYKESLDSFQTERFKPVNPGSTFKPDIEAVYMVFDLLPRENPANVIGQLFLVKGGGVTEEQFLYEEAVHLTTAQDSGFIEFRRPTGGWVSGDYKVKIHIGEKVTDASQLGTLRFTIEPAQ